MKEKIITAVSSVLIFIPWTILILRTNKWALESPAAEILIFSYAGFMIASAAFVIWGYIKEKVQNTLMKGCLVINCLYGVGGAAAIIMMLVQKLV
ncbi:hypothetical protein [Murimonas intestini]|uniref:Uncharacterized protein n=1 Tax=Murimonas intestini TaxID=1337051 RepID=A0AB73T6J4_9FIRM|nr:hypothetical protein [Murimonas intestini]MCR1839530.1 hypothetical protein [Murimonas intestini]MCR1866374.1 hypothetical protein [Murimonas intestini]MCR1882509.1 hypothetical protein [Murimonas intestini]